MALTALDIKDKTFKLKFRGYDEDEVNEFLDIIVDDYEDLVRLNHEQENKIKTLEDKLAYFDEMKESLSQSVILAQETAEKLKTSANDEVSNLMNKANYDAKHLIDEAKLKANQILRDATDEAKRIAVETEDLKRQTRVFHQRLVGAIEGQLSLANSPEWSELLQPTAIYLQNSDAAFREVVGKALGNPKENSDDLSIDSTRQFTSEEMEELQRRIEESNKHLEETQKIETLDDDIVTSEENLNETQTFKLNIEE